MSTTQVSPLRQALHTLLTSTNSVLVYDTLREVLSQVDTVEQEDRDTLNLIELVPFSHPTIETEEIQLDYGEANKLLLAMIVKLINGETPTEEELGKLSTFHHTQSDIRVRTLAVLNYDTFSIIDIGHEYQRLEGDGEEQVLMEDGGLTQVHNDNRRLLEGLVVIEAQQSAPPAFLQALITFSTHVLIPYSHDDFGRTTLTGNVLKALIHNRHLNDYRASDGQRTVTWLLELNPITETRSIFHPSDTNYDGQQQCRVGLNKLPGLLNQIASALISNYSLWKISTK